MTNNSKTTPLCGSCSTSQTCSSLAKSVFSGLSLDSIKCLNQEKLTKEYKKGQTLFIEGHPHHGLFCINSGKVKLVKSTPDGHETILRVAKPGDIIGGASLLRKSGYAMTATVIEDATICLISDELIQELLNRDRVLSINMIRRWDDEMQSAHDVAHALAYKSSKSRLAYMLLQLLNSFESSDERGRYLDLQLTREEYAALIGVAVENVIRCFAELKKESIIMEDKKRIYIQDMSRLQQVAQG